MTWKGALPWPGFALCRCGCEAEGMKLQLRHDKHLVGCECSSCRGRRNRKAGQRTQARTHKRLGGQGFTPTNEESARAYEVTASIMPEVKGGQQIPASFERFISSEWFRHALSQSTRGIPTGSGVLPAVSIRGDFVILDIRGKRLLSDEEVHRKHTGPEVIRRAERARNRKPGSALTAKELPAFLEQGGAE